MVRNNFPALLGDRLESITTVARCTGISRTTLTNLYYRRTQQISLDVLEKLCQHLDCTPNDIFECRPIDRAKGA